MTSRCSVQNTMPDSMFPSWVPQIARADIRKRYCNGEFFGRSWKLAPTGGFLGDHFTYPGQKPFGTVHVWVGRSEFLNSSGKPEIEFQYYQEFPEDIQWWTDWIKKNPKNDPNYLADKMLRSAMDFNKVMNDFLKSNISIATARENTIKKFKDDFMLGCVGLLHHLFAY